MHLNAHFLQQFITVAAFAAAQYVGIVPYCCYCIIVVAKDRCECQILGRINECGADAAD